MTGTIGLENAGLGFGLVVGAGLSTAVGAAAVFEKRVVKLANNAVLASGLGFSSGVMIYVSFVEIFVKSKEAFEADGREENSAYFCATACLFAGMLLLRLLALLVHRIDKSHHAACDGDCIEQAREVSVNVPPLVSNEAGAAPAVEQSAPRGGDADAEAPAQPAAEAEAGSKDLPAAPGKAEQDKRELQTMGINTTIAIAIHNFPEGLATFVGTLADPAIGVTLAIAIGVHNIPEGLCVALPIYYSTNSRLRGFLWALLSGLSEPVGAFVGWAIIKSSGNDMNQGIYGVLFGLVAGMMIMIVILELLPTAYKYDPTDRVVTSSVVVGMAVMALSLCLFMI